MRTTPFVICHGRFLRVLLSRVCYHSSASFRDSSLERCAWTVSPLCLSFGWLMVSCHCLWESSMWSGPRIRSAPLALAPWLGCKIWMAGRQAGAATTMFYAACMFAAVAVCMYGSVTKIERQISCFPVNLM